jgi:hypothetical protein
MDNTDEFLERCNQLMMGQSPVDILGKAYTTISNPGRWAVGAQALSADGYMVRPHDPRAVAWDVEGAVAMASNSYGILPPYFMLLLDSVAQSYGVLSIGLLNDSMRHEVVLEVLEKAIALAGGEHG